jgi:hypothetical protein
MGTDIHGVFQRHDKGTGQWQDIASNYHQDRHYQLFAVLADVRNGYGFAGVPTGQAVKPIAEPRGLPADFAVNGDYCDSHPLARLEHMDPMRQKYHLADEKLEQWMGDHSHSWLTGAEMLAWYETAPEVVKTGILGRAVYESWDGKSTPSSYCGGISGRDVVQINDSAVEKEQKPNWTHIRCTWESGLRSELSYFFDEVARLVADHGDVRFVFGFDS